MQAPQINMGARRHILATRAGPLQLVPRLFDNFGFRQVFDARVRRAGDLLAWAWPARRLRGSRFHIPSLMQFSRFGTATSVAVLQCH